MKILHLSDLHVGYRDCAERFEIIVQNIIAALTPSWQYVIVITGDIVDKGKQSRQYSLAKDLLGRLETAGFTVLLVPGNHDYGTGITPSDEYGKRFNETFYGDPDLTYPILGRAQTPGLIADMAFIGLDSMDQEVDERESMWGAQGKLGLRQLDRLDSLLGYRDVKNARRRILYLHHHPFNPLRYHQLRDSADLYRVLAKHNNIDAILFGHNHGGWKWHGAWGIPRCYDAGSATRKKENPGYHRVMDLDKEILSDFDGDFFGARVLDKPPVEIVET